jgi:hypothetical protein
MRRVVVSVASTVLVATAAGPAAATIPDPLPPVVTQASVVPAPELQARTAKYPVYGADGRRKKDATWRVTPAGQNCCEVYVSATPSGRLLTFGGTFPFYSDDQGKTWFRVEPVTPLNNGEGAIVPGQEGTAFGVGWDAYSGDHLQAFRYTPSADGGVWEVSEQPLHTPFFDRPWITYAKGPFNFGGTTNDAALMVSGGPASEDPAYLSGDGLHYSEVTSPGIDEMSSEPIDEKTLPVAANPLADWWQSHPWPGTLPLAGGGLYKLDVNDFADCVISRLDQESGQWRCSSFTAPGFESDDGPFCCQLRQDSRGWLTLLQPTAKRDALEYRLSTDGGASWSKPLLLKPPAGDTLETDDFYAATVNGARGLAVVQARFDDADDFQGHDMVFRVDVSRATPKLRDVMLVGKGDLITANDVSGSTGDRFDYPSVTLLPNGAIAMSFDDSTTREVPETAYVELRQQRDELTGKDAHSPNLAVQVLR